jgi:hypothetical protein
MQAKIFLTSSSPCALTTACSGSISLLCAIKELRNETAAFTVQFSAMPMETVAVREGAN